MIFWQISTDGDRNFGYLIGDIDTRKAAVIDPSHTPNRFIEAVKKPGLQIIYTIGTHSHRDHTEGMARIRKETGAKSIRHTSSRGRPDFRAFDGCLLKLGNLVLKIIHTPGHTPDSICILVENKLVTGDTLFVGKVGGTKTDNMARKEFKSLFNKLMKLDDTIEVYPGHDFGVSPKSTIGRERRTNPFLLCKNFNDFKWLKNNWESYKLKHGIE